MKVVAMSDNEDVCPLCNADLQGEPIPEKDQHLFGNTHFSRRLGIYDLHVDRTVSYKCPDCGGEWKR